MPPKHGYLRTLIASFHRLHRLPKMQCCSKCRSPFAQWSLYRLILSASSSDCFEWAMISFISSWPRQYAERRACCVIQWKAERCDVGHYKNDVHWIKRRTAWSISICTKGEDAMLTQRFVQSVRLPMIFVAWSSMFSFAGEQRPAYDMYFGEFRDTGIKFVATQMCWQRLNLRSK